MFNFLLLHVYGKEFILSTLLHKRKIQNLEVLTHRCAYRVQFVDASESVCHSFSKGLCFIILFITILHFEGYPGGSQSSVAGYSQLPFPAASQTHWRSSNEGR